jgi:hypothetical protein
MTWFTSARRVFRIVAMSIVAVTGAACGSGQDPVAGAGHTVVKTGANPYADRYSCYFADDGGADRVVDGRTLHWCGPVPRPKN